MSAAMNLFFSLLSLLLVFAHSSCSLFFHSLYPLEFVVFAKPTTALTYKPPKIDTHHHFVTEFYIKGKW
jgi:hypothetical protein